MLLKCICSRLEPNLSSVRGVGTPIGALLNPRSQSVSLPQAAWISHQFSRFIPSCNSLPQCENDVTRLLVRCGPTEFVSSKLPFSSKSSELLNEVSSKVVRVPPYYGLLRLSGDVRFVVIPDIEHQCGTMCRVRLLASGAAAEEQVQQDAVADVQVHQDASVLQVEAVRRGGSDRSPVCEVKLPVKYDIEASLQGEGSIEIFELQNESTSVTTEEGSLATHKLQCLHLSYATASGPLFIGRKFLGNLTASARDLLAVSGDMVQAEKVGLQAPEVQCRLQGLHAKALKVGARHARLHLADVTSDMSSVEADDAQIAMGNCSGRLLWTLGSASVEVAVPQLLDDSSIAVTEGRVSVGCPAEYRYGFSATAPEVVIDSSFRDVSFSASLEGLKRAIAGPPSPVLSVALERGRCAVVPWTWPRTSH